MKVTGVILAGGMSLRMGQNKALMDYQGRPMVSWVAQSLAGVDELLVNANERKSEYQKLGFQVIKDYAHSDIPQQSGPLLGVLSGLHGAAHDWVIFSPCDTPHLPKHYVSTMVQAAQKKMCFALVAFDGERNQNLHLLLHKSLLDNLMMYLLSGQRKTFMWLKSVGVETVDFSEDAEGFANLNSPADLPQPSLHL